MPYTEFSNEAHTYTGFPGSRTADTGTEVNRYRQLLAQPVAALVRSTDERPEISDVVVLGYN
ncbi:hypothetical protein [Paraburkholderia bannensis]|uniref:hypothetical protein n=1 Tax=Paraburkholderia bannensis TaxID=765414 RepID=UPI002ABDF927|nr:hypothetical protein [Paraburkholderia bannensis]